MQIVIPFHSFIDVITNSSTEIKEIGEKINNLFAHEARYD